jgi:prepilin-type N-terminal cleavage/methylation domain-containing protein
MLKRKGFTLIELLVVIAIIALLLSILIPTLTKVKYTVEEVMCKNNLHQYALATELYATEQNDWYPSAWESLYSQIKYTNEGNYRNCRWHNELYDLEAHPEHAGPYWPYLNMRKANVCPTFNRFARKFAENHDGHSGSHVPIAEKVNFSYSMNGNITPSVNNIQKGKKKSQIKSPPSNTFLWSEENMWCIKDSDTGNTTLSEYVLNDNSLLIQPGARVIDNFGSFHKVSVANFIDQMPPDGPGKQYGVYKSGGVNALLMDGSAVFVTPYDGQNKKYIGRL